MTLLVDNRLCIKTILQNFQIRRNDASRPSRLPIMLRSEIKLMTQHLAHLAGS